MKKLNSRRIRAGALVALVVAGGAVTAPVLAEAPPGQQQVGLDNDTATDYPTGSGPCDFVGADTSKDYWHFVIAPQGTFEFGTIHLVTTGDPDGSDYPFLPNGSADRFRYDNVFVEVPSGVSLTDLVKEGSYAWITPDTPEPNRFNLSHTCTDPGPSEPDVTVTKTVDTDWSRTHRWDIDKELVSGPTAVYSGNAVTGANVTYRVTQTELSAVDAYSVSGTITVSNGTDVPATVTAVTDALPGFTCVVDDLPSEAVVTSAAPLELDYACDPLSSLPGGELTNTATASFSFEGGSSTQSSEAMPVTFSDTPDEEIDESPTLSDDKYSGVVAGTDYTIFVPASTETCRTGFTNTATLTGEGGVIDSDYVTVQFCVSIGGRTIGFWSNNNGAVALNSGSPTIWSQVTAAYPNITLSLSTVSQLQSFLTARTTNCSTDCITMLRAQFIGTALNALYITDYAGQAVVVPTSLDTVDGSANGCTTVTNLLASIYAQYPFGSTAERVIAKTTLDTINQDKPVNPFQCTP